MPEKTEPTFSTPAGLNLSVTEIRTRKKTERTLSVRISASLGALRVADLLSEFGHYPSFRDFVARELAVSCERYFEEASELIKNVGQVVPKSKPSQAR